MTETNRCEALLTLVEMRAAGRLVGAHSHVLNPDLDWQCGAGNCASHQK